MGQGGRPVPRRAQILPANGDTLIFYLTEFLTGGKEDIGKVENFLIADTFLQEQIDVHLQRNEPNGQQ